MFKKAYGKYAVGAFNVNNMEIIQDRRRRQEEQAPLIPWFGGRP
jgi:fructose-bisphosphate aldolase class II